MAMNADRKLKQYEHALREWRKQMKNGKFSYHEPTPEEHGLKRVEEIFCAKKLRQKIMEETESFA